MQKIILLDVSFDLRNFGVGYTDFPYQIIGAPQKEDINIEISEDCPKKIKDNILKKADELCEELYNLLLEKYKEISKVLSSAYSDAEESLKNYYYYVDNTNNLMLMLNKDGFDNEQKADLVAKKEITKIYNKQTNKTKLSI